MICYYFLRYDLLWQPIVQPTPPPPPPCTFTLTTVYKINCCTFLFNMSYSRIAAKKKNSVITIKRNEKLHCTNIKNSKSLKLNTWWLFLSG